MNLGVVARFHLTLPAFPQNPMLARLNDPTLWCGKALDSSWEQLKRREKVEGPGSHLKCTVLRSHFIMCMHLVKQETFLQQQFFFPLLPLVDMLKDHT